MKTKIKNKMKNLRNLFTLLLVVSFATVFTSCGGDESEDPTPVTTLSVDDLLGSWSFEQLVYNGDTWIDCNKTTTQEYKVFDGVFNKLDLNVANTNLGSTMSDDCNGFSANYNVEVINNGTVLHIEAYGTSVMKFDIVSTDLDGQVKRVELKMTESTNLKSPIGGVYTLTK